MDTVRTKKLNEQEIQNHIIQLENDGEIDFSCPACRKYFYPELSGGKKFWMIHAPAHNPSPRCESGKRNHCTCDVCF